MPKYRDINEQLVVSIAELRALERYTVEALELQQHEDDLEDHAAAAKLIEQIAETLKSHIKELDYRILALGGSMDALRIATTSIAGAFLGFLSKTRSHDTSKILRDDYTLLSLVSMGYVVLHTASLALRKADIAGMALQHRHELVPLLEEIALLLPHMVLRDLSRNFSGLDAASANPPDRIAPQRAVPDTPWAALA